MVVGIFVETECTDCFHGPCELHLSRVALESLLLAGFLFRCVAGAGSPGGSFHLQSRAGDRRNSLSCMGFTGSCGTSRQRASPGIPLVHVDVCLRDRQSCLYCESLGACQWFCALFTLVVCAPLTYAWLFCMRCCWQRCHSRLLAPLVSRCPCLSAMPSRLGHRFRYIEGLLRATGCPVARACSGGFAFFGRGAFGANRSTGEVARCSSHQAKPNGWIAS